MHSCVWRVLWALGLFACGAGPAGPADVAFRDATETTDRMTPADEGFADSRFDTPAETGGDDAVLPDLAADALVPDAPVPDVPSDLETPGTGDAPLADPESGPDLSGDPGPAPGPCESNGGLCVPTARACQQGGGTAFPEGDSQCLFDDGPLVCCIPPSPQGTGDDCVARGGLCVTTPGVCNRTGGIHAPRTNDCPVGPGSLCCLPADRCPPGDDLECCMGSWTAVPQCDRGTWTCLGGGSPQPRGSCLPD